MFLYYIYSFFAFYSWNHSITWHVLHAFLCCFFLKSQPAPYCWWLKSCTSWYGKYPIIYRLSYIPGGAGFQPSTVGINPSNCFFSLNSFSPFFRPGRRYKDWSIPYRCTKTHNRSGSFPTIWSTVVDFPPKSINDDGKTMKNNIFVIGDVSHLRTEVGFSVCHVGFQGCTFEKSLGSLEVWCFGVSAEQQAIGKWSGVLGHIGCGRRWGGRASDTHPALLKMAIPFFLVVAKSELLQLKWNTWSQRASLEWPNQNVDLWNFLNLHMVQDMNADVNDNLQHIPGPCPVLQSIEKHLSYAWSQPNQHLYCCSWVLTKSVGWYLHPFISMWQKPAYVSTLASNYEKIIQQMNHSSKKPNNLACPDTEGMVLLGIFPYI